MGSTMHANVLHADRNEKQLFESIYRFGILSLRYTWECILQNNLIYWHYITLLVKVAHFPIIEASKSVTRLCPINATEIPASPNVCNYLLRLPCVVYEKYIIYCMNNLSSGVPPQAP